MAFAHRKRQVHANQLEVRQPDERGPDDVREKTHARPEHAEHRPRHDVPQQIVAARRPGRVVLLRCAL
ncbi:MAG: hypothetical protein CMJ18_14470 [Phycisphaeraceae bacterium]|nr:hypothetical protein [Phycisphaeraceae bacterium]